MSLMPSCKDVTQQSSDYLENHLPWWKRPGYWLHVMMCVNCRRYVDQLKLTITTLGHTKEATPPDVSTQQVQDIVENMQKQAVKVDEK